MPDDPDAVGTLTRVLVRACRALAEAGQPHRAGLLAADAWVAVRHTHPRQAQHLDGAMHHIARLEQRSEDRPTMSPTLAGDPTRKERSMSSAPTEDRVLDVRTEEPKRRHELIFETFTDLPVGQTYVLVNDHDPKPLRYQFEAENAGEFSWQYLEEGPEVWRVRIGRTAAPGGSASS
ncbi:MAG: DUF2249 domain-containing protein [Streptosporangiaceae bacterium]